jgi:predicted DNA-binding transcriptional regulator AlpA
MNKTYEKKLLSAAETAQYLGLSVRTLYNMTGRKAKVKFPVKPKRIGKLLKFDLLEINDYIDSL